MLIVIDPSIFVIACSPLLMAVDCLGHRGGVLLSVINRAISLHRLLIERSLPRIMFSVVELVLLCCLLDGRDLLDV